MLSAANAALLALGGVQALAGALTLGVALSNHGHSVAAAQDRGHLDLVLRHSEADAHDHADGGDLHGADSHEHVVHLVSEEPTRERTRHTAATAPSVVALPIRVSADRLGPVASRTRASFAPPLARRSVVLRV
jgi:hypothetical protein